REGPHLTLRVPPIPSTAKAIRRAVGLAEPRRSATGASRDLPPRGAPQLPHRRTERRGARATRQASAAEGPCPPPSCPRGSRPHPCSGTRTRSRAQEVCRRSADRATQYRSRAGRRRRVVLVRPPVREAPASTGADRRRRSRTSTLVSTARPARRKRVATAG